MMPSWGTPRAILAVLLVVFAERGQPSPVMAQRLSAETGTTVSGGWHPWYELKADPEDPKNLIVCGTKWDASRNGPIGFVYFSSDGGQTWRSVLADKSSLWVTEHSCAFGPNHMAFFVSGISKVIDGRPHHELGRTKIFVSVDAGRHWVESAETGWTDYSTSAVSSRSGRLFTFFNSFDTSSEWGNHVGLVVFRSPSRGVVGPFLDRSAKPGAYRATFPSGAVPLRDGAVVALYYGERTAENSLGADIGVVHADDADTPTVKETAIARIETDPSAGCDTLEHNALAYDRIKNRLFLVYASGCSHRDQMLLTSSDDEGKTWSKPHPVVRAVGSTGQIRNPSLVVDAKGRLFLLWREQENSTTLRWLSSSIEDSGVLGAAVVLSQREKCEPTSEALRTVLSTRNEEPGNGGSAPGTASITFGVFSEACSVWRASGLAQTDNGLLAIWSSTSPEGTRLVRARVGEEATPARKQQSRSPDVAKESDVTATTRLLFGYGSSQSFDRDGSSLRVCLSLANSGTEPLAFPVKLRVEDMSSDVGAIKILNATNHVQGKGAEWNISESITGNQLAPRTNTHPICFLFHVEGVAGKRDTSEPLDLVRLRVKVLADEKKSPGQNPQIPD